MPGKLNYGSPGAGSVGHLVAALFLAWLVAGVAIDPETEDDPHKDPEHWGRS